MHPWRILSATPGSERPEACGSSVQQQPEGAHVGHRRGCGGGKYGDEEELEDDEGEGPDGENDGDADEESSGGREPMEEGN